MRFGPAALALSLALAITASVSQARDPEPSARAAMLIAEGRSALSAGQPQRAIDAFEAALAVDPAYTPVFLHLAEAARREGLQGKAIRYYREALKRDPGNLAAISGEGAALVEKGAIEKARVNLSKLESICGRGCAETQRLAIAIQQGPQPQVLRAEAVLPDAEVTQN
ncbi:tetratricopeptide repeat protein [Pontixanthobacter sp.]|uniref:tetratricopeptide repeat protein n=1 Tax=Pontixanthobacter sp. TaxID=2792078 RepID=UPI003C7BDA0C